jgi:hypothetical protein
MATLTGAARIALGPQLPPFYTDDDELAGQIEAAARPERSVWRMPLWKPYADALDSDVAEIKNDPDGWAQAGSVTAALFLQRFAPQGPGPIWISSRGTSRPPGIPGGCGGPGDPGPLPHDPRAFRMKHDPRITPCRDGIAARSLEACWRPRSTSTRRR